ncbi:MAG: 50S ribosomal protein L24 [Ilumatobacteraceae bacterium]|jgi:large subunit ribosomal protein L24|nr:50S ribosomal protein L24 [Actinomycetes bacterium]
MKLRKGDTVRVIHGKNAGKEGQIKQVLPAANKVVVEGVNIAKRHTIRRNEKQQSEIKEIEMPIAASNVMLVHKGKVTRVGFKVDAKGNKVRIARRTGDEL